MAEIKETKEMLKFILKLAEAAGKSLADGRIGVADIFYVFGVLQTIGPAIEGIVQIPGELTDLDDAEKEELKKLIEDFDIPEDQIELLIEMGLKALVDALALIKFFKK